ncbi:sigma-E factor negative regulatory protein [Pelomonas sp. KK5]|uniref:sigma-E factor negative regulatory protein n=1 Tax=Pelomonas sp. KK5 TaxID=1855730 RepID=UPI00097C1DE9|nr:sigma-E factor negative regulatory protein [Pelomonas sp. KK5]
MRTTQDDQGAHDHDPALLQALSDLADGRASAEQLQALSAAWATNPALRRDWQSLHLIGDSLRSGELAGQAQPAEDLLAGLRRRIAQEPVPLRPRGWQAWLAPLAVAASFVLVALAVPGLQSMLLRQPGAGQMAMPSASTGGPVLTGSALAGGQPSFAQTMAEPGLPALRNAAQAPEAVAPFELSLPPPPAAASR